MKHLLQQLGAGMFVFALLGGAVEAKTLYIDVLTTFDYPSGNSTQPRAINNANQIAGTFADVDARTKGFVREADGSFSAPLVEPNDFGLETIAAGINDLGTVSGYYTGPGGFFSGFFLNSSTYTEFNVPGAIDTFITGINGAGDFVGYSSDGTTGKTQAFVSIGGTIMPIVIPGASYSFAYALNSRGQYCGYYQSGRAHHGFYLDRNGTLRYPVDAPGDSSVFYGINDRGWLVGSTTDSSGATHGLLLMPPKTFTTYYFPGANFTRFDSINNKGIIAGDESSDPFGSAGHGFIARVKFLSSDD